MRNWMWISWLALASAAGCGDATSSMTQTITVAAELGATFTAPTCTVVDGTSVRVTGELALGGLDARLIFRNNQKGTHEAVDDVTATTVLIPEDQTIEIPTPSLPAGSGAAPTISVQFFDGAGNALTGEVALGSCDDAGFPAEASVGVATSVTLTVSAEGCTNHPGPTITVEGAVEFAGLRARIVVRAADGSEAGAVTADADVVALAAGEKLSIPKQPSRGGVGGNPWIWAQLVDASGAPVTDELLIGRCVAE